ncbi:hypothetical protein M430DRAFT_36283 [Amorphotheca resinae ATCC 22711]|uniref:Translation initiation factor 3 N-terminal domain-containing protein n=1 Tax=Amorphotheca resinae ATCC 22711 TaxID=857342 RepID=A0A2T3AWZ2_AMORE|nr:hypothetical protein M430DRAFT_36283 [Amorphotheca resinae ATCC 22711]PSS13150.1 hypothetical protein M430DRAFT_36283 [Amorphotheca resinae ATCC 22711]
MRSPRCIFSAATALHRVFIAPIEQSNLQFALRIPSSTAFISHSPAYILPQQRRCYAAPSSTERRLPRDDQIKSWSVTLVDENGKLSEPRQTSAVLDSIDRNKDSLVVVAQGEPGTPPICRIMNKKAMRDAEKAKAKAARGSSITTKTIELNWAIDKGDLWHRMDKMKQFLSKGFRVEIMLASKKKGRQATVEEAEELLRKIKEAVGEVEGSKETKPMEGKLLKAATLYLEGKAVQKGQKA